MNLERGSRIHAIFFAIQALRELGAGQLGLYALYKFGLRSGHYRRLTNRPPQQFNIQFAPFFSMPDPDILRHTLGDDGVRNILIEADEIVSGRVRLFGGNPVPLRLIPEGRLQHWTVYESEQPTGAATEKTDIKLIWEPARFGWAYCLGRAYKLTDDERYPAAFWHFTNLFLDANPVYYGPNWSSAQEVALRLMAFCFAWQVFDGSTHSTRENTERLLQAIAEHAARIPVTLVYARSQNNNHLLSEAAGLYTAGACLANHPQAGKWRELGWKWFNQGVLAQIDEDGAYCQHSTNYHRLMLQLGLWFKNLAEAQNQPLPVQTKRRLAAATAWLSALTDPQTGCAPNLGPNDGAYIQPLTVCPFADYRPVLQSAGHAFLDEYNFPNGAWDEMDLWYNASCSSENLSQTTQIARRETPHILKSLDRKSWAYLRMAQFHSRPGHADQLHLDLWWKGLNLACDAGTYQYNAAAPWDNALSNTAVHNTMTIDGREQMQRFGRFLYLHWAQAVRIDGEQDVDGAWCRLVGQHDGYRSIGLLHQRSVTTSEDSSWLVEDLLLPTKPSVLTAQIQFTVRLHWLLPDWPWELEGTALHLQSPKGSILVRLQIGKNGALETQQVGLARAGQSLIGSGPVDPTWGWQSSTYAQKIPALSFFISARTPAPVVFATRWDFPVE